MFQMRKPHKTPAEKLGDMETSNLPKKEFRVMIAWMTKEPTRRMDSQREKSDVSKKEFTWLSLCSCSSKLASGDLANSKIHDPLSSSKGLQINSQYCNI